ncbi:MAG: NAD-dependent deacylase [Endomicrobiaceae bacterium]|nr:NAD-dependent deacylase [Endomicrobiaceae bacterium]
MNNIEIVADLIKKSKYAIGFTGAGISVESGIPPFTGAGGLWNKYDPKFIELSFFYSNPERSWEEMRKIFFNSMGTAQPNKAHQVLANLEKQGVVKGIITQNIDGLHQAAGSTNVVEFHGTINTLACIDCKLRYKTSEIDISKDIPRCPSCNGILKPDFVFYGEGINKNNYDKATNLAVKADLVIIVGTAGQVMPACYLPFTSQKYGAKIIEVNTLESSYTDQITDYFFQTKATEFFGELERYL